MFAIKSYKELLRKLPYVNQEVVRQLLHVLSLVSINSEINKMVTNNLSIIFGSMSGIFVSSNDSSTSELVEFLIDNYGKIYEDDNLLFVKAPTFTRRLICEKSILSLLNYGRHMISTDSLEARIWRKRSYKLVKSLVFGERLYSNPTIMNDKLYVPLIESGNIGVWNLVELIDNDNKINIKIAVNSLKSSLITVKDTIWCVGNKITIIDSNHNVEEIGENVTNAQFKLELIENNVWIFFR